LTLVVVAIIMVQPNQKGEWEMDTEGDPVTIEKLKTDLRVLAADMEQLLKATASQTGQQVAQVRAKAEDSLKLAMARVAELQDVALTKSRAAGRATDEYVRANPWQVLAIGAFAGLVLGLLLTRGRDSDS
jgi:ElaB/YqjD/DUF883 family membrane-anchored ribosome-binding protein